MKNNNRIHLALILIISLIFSSYNGNAQEKQHKQAINVCAIAIPVMNFYVLNYEYLHKDRHGLALRVEYAPKMEGAHTNGIAWAGVINYRWHICSKLEGVFVGPYARYRYVYGEGSAIETNYDFKVPEFNLGLNTGYRWISKIGINVVISAGYGYSWSFEELSPESDIVLDEFNKFKKANDANTAILDAPFYGELSIGYAF